MLDWSCKRRQVHTDMKQHCIHTHMQTCMATRVLIAAVCLLPLFFHASHCADIDGISDSTAAEALRIEPAQNDTEYACAVRNCARLGVNNSAAYACARVHIVHASSFNMSA